MSQRNSQALKGGGGLLVITTQGSGVSGLSSRFDQEWKQTDLQNGSQNYKTEIPGGIGK